ncbi:GNAT family N-acetyltransferase [Mesorhizobium sp. M1300]|uniref:GNAT family N-acetyltransferase n=1 Tax=Mesorhizobium sp. M1300 TaxID=2957077 RepID=UPI003337A93B
MASRVATLGLGAYCESLYRFRYNIYVEELGLSPPEADHSQRLLYDELDQFSVSYVLLDAEKIVGGLRRTCIADVPNPSSLAKKFLLDSALHSFESRSIMATSRFMIHPAYRGSIGMLRLMETAYVEARKAGIRLNYGDCSEEMRSFYEHMGYRVYGPKFFDSSYGEKYLLIMLLGDVDWFRHVRSPIRRTAALYGNDTEARLWFDQNVDSTSNPGNNRPKA